MEGLGPLPRLLGVAGPAQTDQERASVKQAIFLLRFHMRILDAIPVDTSLADADRRPQ